LVRSDRLSAIRPGGGLHSHHGTGLIQSAACHNRAGRTTVGILRALRVGEPQLLIGRVRADEVRCVRSFANCSASIAFTSMVGRPT
jgi:hypothetical protein